ncbi:MAG: DUF5103 domain-containing protein [Adhaeribacter sp.]
MRQQHSWWYCIPVIFLLLRCVPVSQQYPSGSGDTGQAGSASLKFADEVYDPSIRTVQCFVESGHPDEVTYPPVVPLSQEQAIVLEFDQLNMPQQRLVAKLIYCNADWTEARITQMQYLQDYNEFYLTDVTPSSNTKVPFFHYRFRVPRVKLSGNYLLVVSDPQGRPLLSRRLLVYEPGVNVAAKPVLTTGGSAQFTNQQLDFIIGYHQYPLVNPVQELQVLMRQNYRWDNARRNLKPQLVKETEKRLEYTFFELPYTFPGLNEYRWFDNRSGRFLGGNVAAANREAVPEEVLLAGDRNRSREAYSQQIDLNGYYVTGNRDFANSGLNADYNWVNFQLLAPQQAAGEVYVFGALSNWQLLPEFKMTYNAANQHYTAKALLKQGYYNYSYVVQAAAGAVNETFFEGSHQQTENIYDILVYYRPPGSRTDLLIGYTKVNYNGRERR